MGHVDDGQLNALLDGELSGPERQTVEAHLAACAECRARFEEARAFLAQATDLLGALDGPAARPRSAPATPSVAAPPSAPRLSTVSRTGKERAIEPGAPRIAATHQERAVDVPEPATAQSKAITDADLTRKSAAIRPLFGSKRLPEPAADTPVERRLPSLAWAAMLVLAVGAGWMANEVLHSGRRAQVVATGAPPQQPAEVAANPTAPAAGTTAGPTSSTARQQARPTVRTPLIKPPAERGDKPPSADEAAANIPRDRPPGAARTEPANTAEAGALAAGRATQQGNAGAGAIPSAPTAAVAQSPAPSVTDATAPRARAAQPAAARLVAPATFRLISMDEAVRRQSGTIRLIDGLQPLRVEAGPGSLVPGAAPTRDVVRIVYADATLGALTLDQQPAEAGAREGASVNGLMPGDTLVTAQPDGTVRVRWIDGKGYWLSLTGRGEADDVRAFVERVR
jgi:anti-sigma factor RsiW